MATNRLSAPADISRPSAAPDWWLALPAALLAAAITLFLLPHWRHNPDLPHGWFMPLVFVWLVYESRAEGKQRFLPAGRRWTTLAAIACVLTGLAALGLGILYTTVLDWTHALVVLLCTGAFCGLMAALWITGADARVRTIPFNWPAAVAISLWFLSIPMPPGTYATITQNLQGFVTSAVLGLLHFLGIAAVQHGNILQLPNVTVGVEEACSGVRSLQSCLYTGLFLSATLVRRPWHRIFVIALAGPLAVMMNIIRSLALTLLAHNDVAIDGAWHDVTGYAVLGVTAAVLAGLALWLARHGPAVSTISRQPPLDVDSARPFAIGAGRAALCGVFIAAVFVGIMLFNLRPAQNTGRTPPDLAALLPAAHAGWTASPNRDLQRFCDELQTTHLAQTTYYRPNPSGGEPVELSVYLAYWPTGSAPVSVVAMHTPDACWPGAGWTMEKSPASPPAPSPVLSTTSTAATNQATSSADRFDRAEHRVFTLSGHSRDVWYWHVYDGRVIRVSDVRSPRQLLFLAWHYGFRRGGEQLFVRVSSNQPLDKIVNEPILQEIFTSLAPFGL